MFFLDYNILILLEVLILMFISNMVLCTKTIILSSVSSKNDNFNIFSLRADYF